MSLIRDFYGNCSLLKICFSCCMHAVAVVIMMICKFYNSQVVIGLADNCLREMENCAECFASPISKKNYLCTALQMFEVYFLIIFLVIKYECSLKCSALAQLV